MKKSKNTKIENKQYKGENSAKNTRGKQTGFNHRKIEAKWQKRWEKEGINKPTDMLNPKSKFYNLWMFPYPSAEGLHAGHAFASTGSDVYGRYTRMNGKETFQPFIGYDSFGIHSENYAIEIKKHPMELTKKTTKHYGKQLKSLGHGYDWTRTVTTSDIDYYRWTQWIFVKLFKAGLAYRRKSSVNWCQSCKTVLADEQVMTPAQAGKTPKDEKGNRVKEAEGMMVCERCGTIAEKKDLEQWFFRITDYADRLLDGLNDIKWPEKIKLAQRNWIGRSEGINIKHKVKDLEIEFEVYDSIPQTHRAQTFVVIAPEHPLVKTLVKGTKYERKVLKFVEKIKKRKTDNKFDEGKEIEGVFTGRYSKNYLGKEVDLPIWVASFAIMDYGTGIVGCSAHDERDFRFAKKYGLKLKPVLFPKEKKLAKKVRNLEVFYREPDGILEEPIEFRGKRWDKVREPIIDYIEKEDLGVRVTNYHLRDWLISRQRYWGTPIPMIFCSKCKSKGKSWFTLKSEVKSPKSRVRNLIHKNQDDWDHTGWYPEEDLPVRLPYISDYKPKGEGTGPLDDHPEFYKVKCPHCSGVAKRETDVSDTFLDSAWYFLRYPSVGIQNPKFKNQNDKSKTINKFENGKWNMEIPWDSEVTRQWLPVDLYFGGAEHAVLHLMYSRFVTMALHDMDYLDFDEPFSHFYAHGLMIKDGAKMSKSRGNVVTPDEYIEKFGADTLRLYLMFMGPMDGYPDFRDTGIEGMRRFVEKVWKLFHSYTHTGGVIQIDNKNKNHTSSGVDMKQLTTKLHKTIKKVTSDIENFRYNTAIASVMEYVNVLRSQFAINDSQLTISSKKKSKPKSDVRCPMSDVWRNALEVLAQLLAPFTPHLAEEVWVNVLGQKFSVHKSKWPQYDSKYIKEHTVTIAVQVNGKLRATLELKTQDSKQKERVIKVAKENENVKKWISGKKIKKEIFVKGKLVNFVVAP